MPNSEELRYKYAVHDLIRLRREVKEENSAKMQFINTKNKIKDEETSKELGLKKKKQDSNRQADLMKTRIHR